MFILLASHQQIIVRTKALPSIGVVVILASVGVIVSVAVSKRSSRSSSTSDDAPRQYQQRYRLPRRQHGVDHPPSRPTTQVLRTRSQLLPLATGKQQLLEVPLFSVSDVRNCNDNDINAEDDEAESTCLKTIVSDINKEERTEVTAVEICLLASPRVWHFGSTTKSSVFALKSKSHATTAKGAVG
ncbi:hypothetical protein F442_09284 [Phytophthora nicotianae P10297]|uniref:Uncharacterized protein n=1 Tax=Phytophthora nicotianae P10297 TaxID=1317064 RepID=W2ZAU7_PHYNI|nr:hypothetical protein F442_09284 [Phytophthora nicotianae P10297]